MNDIEQVNALLLMASKDLRALEGMVRDPEAFADEIFGFHAQQAVEKVLKAWLASKGEVYPLTHNLATLAGRLEAIGEDVDSLENLIELTSFSVTFRYGPVGEEEPLDRKSILDGVRQIVGRVRSSLGEAV